jgi:hypothetical protein
LIPQIIFDGLTGFGVATGIWFWVVVVATAQHEVTSIVYRLLDKVIKLSVYVNELICSIERWFGKVLWGDLSSLVFSTGFDNCTERGDKILNTSIHCMDNIFGDGIYSLEGFRLSI